MEFVGERWGRGVAARSGRGGPSERKNSSGERSFDPSVVGREEIFAGVEPSLADPSSHVCGCSNEHSLGPF